MGKEESVRAQIWATEEEDSRSIITKFLLLVNEKTIPNTRRSLVKLFNMGGVWRPTAKSGRYF